jgi:hypothetical protein
MSVTVDDEPLAAETLGLSTVGHVLNHLRERQRLVVHVMIDGREPNFDEMAALRAQPIGDRTVYIETAEPQRIAADVFDQVDCLLVDAETAREQVVARLQAGEHAEALKKLGGCFTSWTQAQAAIEQVARLLRIDLGRIDMNDGTLAEWLGRFAGQLGEIRGALENRDYPLLADLLQYEAHETGGRWRDAIAAMRSTLK